MSEKRKHQRMDPDFKAVKHATLALLGSSTPRMMRANMEYLIDRFLRNPPRCDMEHFATKDAKSSRLSRDTQLGVVSHHRGAEK